MLPTPCNLLVLTFISLLMLNDPFYICRLRSSSSICLWNVKPHIHSPFHVLSDSLSVISRPHFILFLICIYISSLLSFFMLANYHIFSLFDLVPFSKIFVPPWPYQFNRWLVIECLPRVRHHLIFWESHDGKIQVLGNEDFFVCLFWTSIFFLLYISFRCTE